VCTWAGCNGEVKVPQQTWRRRRDNGKSVVQRLGDRWLCNRLRDECGVCSSDSGQQVTLLYNGAVSEVSAIDGKMNVGSVVQALGNKWLYNKKDAYWRVGSSRFGHHVALQLKGQSHEIETGYKLCCRIELS
jgi:hypothetical protein